MSRGGKRLCVGLASLVVGLLAAAPPAPAAPGDVYGSNYNLGALLEIPPGGAAPTAVGGHSFGDLSGGLTMGPDGFLYIAEQTGEVHRVDPRTGDFTTPIDVAPDPATDVDFDAAGNMVVASVGSERVVRVNPVTGASTPIVDLPNGPYDVASVAVERGGAILIGEGEGKRVLRYAGGTLTPILQNDPELGTPADLALSADERYLYVASFGIGDERVFRWDRRTGAASKFTTPDLTTSVAILPTNQLLVAHNSGIGIYAQSGGSPTSFSDHSGATFVRSLTIEPRRCAGRTPTVVGTSARDVIKGSPFADVISTLGGKDVIRGLGGRDVVCAGLGRDKLIGGAGRDRLLGQGGHDRIVGGGGRDVCRGGPGRDRQVSC